MSDLVARIERAQRDAGGRAVDDHLDATLKHMATGTYVGRNGEPQPERRRKVRDGDDPRIDHLFNGFDNCIESAKANNDRYREHYLRAMRQEFGELIKALEQS